MEITASMVKVLREKTQAGMMDCKKALTEVDGDLEKAIDLLREKGLSKAAKKADRIAAEGLVKLIIANDMKSGALVEVNSETDFVAKNEEFIGFVEDLAKMVLETAPASTEDLKNTKYMGTQETVQDVLNNKIARIGENMNLRRSAREDAKGAVVGYLHGAGKIAVLVNFDSDAAAEDLQELGKDVAMQIAAMNPMYISRDDVDQSYIEHEREILTAQAINEGKSEEIAKKMVEGRLNKQLKEVCLLEQVFVKDSDFTVKQIIENKAKALGKEIKIAGVQRFEVGEGIEKKEENFADEVAKQLGN